MSIYNVHTPSKTFALSYKEDEDQSKLLQRIFGKLSLGKEDTEAIREGKDGAGLVYEFEGGRWSLDDDDDLSIFHSRLPQDKTPSATLHLNLPHHHAHFAPIHNPPAYTSASSAIKTKASKPKPKAIKTLTNGTSNSTSPLSPTSAAVAAGATGRELGPVKGPLPKIPDGKAGAGTTAPIGKVTTPPPTATPEKPKSVFSMQSGKSRRSKWGNDDAEPFWDAHKKLWYEFQSHQGVRTVMGRVGNISNIRMLLKPGYLHVYVSRAFAIKHHLVSPTYAMGAGGYTGLKTLGNISITVGSHTASHPAFISEEQHFDVTLGRKWMEKMGVKTDNLDPTALTYMDTGEPISCEMVVLKDADGNVVLLT